MSKSLIYSAVLVSLVSAFAFITGCAPTPVTVPLASSESSIKAKEFTTPSEGKAGIYVYRRDSYLGRSFTKDVYIDGICLGQTAPNVFFYIEVEGNKTHTIANDKGSALDQTEFYTEAGKNYFFEQFMKMTMFEDVVIIRQVDEYMAKPRIINCQQAIPGTCSNQ